LPGISHRYILPSGAAPILGHLQQVPSIDVQAQQQIRARLDDWCTGLRLSQITTPGCWWPFRSLSKTCISTVFAWNPFGSHWVAVDITKAGAITIWDSCWHISAPLRKYAQLVLPTFAQLIALNPDNEWVDSAFFDSQVVFPTTPQQQNSDDCGPAAATTLYHTLRMEGLEETLNGNCLRFAHMAMLYNAIHGPCPFISAGDTQSYALPLDQEPLVDPKILQLLSTQPSVLSDGFISRPSNPGLGQVPPLVPGNRHPQSPPPPSLALGQPATDLILRIVATIRAIMEPEDTPTPRLHMSDPDVILWNILSFCGTDIMQLHSL
jgi:hypothetical protein